MQPRQQDSPLYIYPSCNRSPYKFPYISLYTLNIHFHITNITNFIFYFLSSSFKRLAGYALSLEKKFQVDLHYLHSALLKIVDPNKSSNSSAKLRKKAS